MYLDATAYIIVGLALALNVLVFGSGPVTYYPPHPTSGANGRQLKIVKSSRESPIPFFGSFVYRDMRSDASCAFREGVLLRS
jgi:hypothetical protein